jgi:RND superfamily putative drug exporter
VLKSISTFATGRRSKFAVVAFWVILGFALSSLQPKLQDATTNENEAFLPESAESTEVNDLIEERFPDGREVDGVVAYENAAGLTAADRERISADALAIAGLEAPDPRAPCANPELVGVLAVIDPFSGPVCGAGKLGGAEAAASAGSAAGGARSTAAAAEQAPPAVSEDGTVALTVVRAGTEESEDIQDNVAALREIVPPPDADGDLHAYVTGVAGIVSDSIEVFESIDVTLLLVTVSLVLFLLLAIYRSPVVAFVPLFVVAIAYLIAAALVYGLVQAGAVEVNGQTTSLLIVLMFGAGTDYCLLIVSRYREELRNCEDKHVAMAHATERTGPAILSAGGTVVAAMLVLALADFKATQTMGPVLALGVAIMLLAGLSLLPALLSILGRRAFWPAIPRYGTEQRAPLGAWRRIGHFVHERPMFALSISVAILLLGSLGNLKDRGIVDFGEGFRDPPESVEGQLLIEERLSGGQTAPTIVLAETGSEQRVAAALRGLEGVDAAVPGAVSEDGGLTRVDVTIAYDPFSDEADDLVPVIRERAEQAAGEQQVLVGGLTAENFDTSETLRSDARLIVPLVLLLIFLILCVLLRALVAPLYLVVTVVLSYAFAIGASTLIFTQIFNQPDSDPGLPTFAFIFLVALGVDYNIFLISRIREEAAYQETKEAVITGLERTGGVITSAGLILAGTFSALMTLPLETLFQIGFTVAFGLLVDTFLIRTIVVPSIAFQLGERNWWPSKISHDAAQAGAPEPEPAAAAAGDRA